MRVPIRHSIKLDAVGELHCDPSLGSVKPAEELSGSSIPTVELPLRVCLSCTFRMEGSKRDSFFNFWY